MLENFHQIETVAITFKAPSEEDLAEQLRILQPLLDRTSLQDITCTHYIKEKRAFRFCARVTASAPLPELMRLISDISTITYG